MSMYCLVIDNGEVPLRGFNLHDAGTFLHERDAVERQRALRLHLSTLALPATNSRLSRNFEKF